jgi:hypothetical protein
MMAMMTLLMVDSIEKSREDGNASMGPLGTQIYATNFEEMASTTENTNETTTTTLMEMDALHSE